MARYTGPVWDPSPNYRAGPTTKIRVVLHRMAGAYAGGLSWLTNPASQVSANFTVDNQTGASRQLVDTADVAWAQADYNDDSISIEIGGQPGDPVADAAWQTITSIVRQAHQVDGVSLIAAAAPTFAGVAYHGQLGARGGNHPDCPGPIVIARIPNILTAARSTTPEEAMGVFNLTATIIDPARPADHLGRHPFWGVDAHGQTFAFNGARLIPSPIKAGSHDDVCGLQYLPSADLLVAFCDDGHPEAGEPGGYGASTFDIHPSP